VQVPPAELVAWQSFLADLPYQHWEETHNPAYRLFLGEVGNSLTPRLAAHPHG
jgi:threonine dehydratase